MGTVAVRASNGGVIENVVVVNPTFRNNGVGTTNLAVGMLVGTVYSANTVIRNNIVIDSVTSLPAVITASTYHTNANGKLSYTSLTEDGQWSFFNGLIGGVGGSASIAGGNRNINDNYCISSNYGGEDFYAYMNYAGSKYTVPTTDAIATTNAIVADFAAFKAANNNDLSAFVLLTDNGSTGTVADYTID